MELVINRNAVYQTAYPVVWCPKYRKPILTGRIATRLRNLLDKICDERKWWIGALEIQPDHVHLFLCLPPSVAIANAVKILKGTTARLLFHHFPAIKQELWDGALWSPSYYVGTAGRVSAETIQRYIERTEHIRGRR